MEITFNQLVPDFLEQEKINQSAVWKQSLVFSKGEHIQLVAPSGSGKTSFIHFLYAVRKDYSGEIKFDGQNIRSMDAEAIASFRSNSISIVFQDLRLFTHQTARENIEVKQRLQPFNGAASIDEMANRLGIYGKLNQAAGTCSYGEQQRIAIIRALQQPFNFLVLDEPFSHLDEANSHKAMDLIIEEATKRNAGIILADLAAVPFYQAGKTLQL